MDNLIFEVLMLSKSHKNEKQTRAILRTLTTSQRYKIQKFIRNILNGKITLSDSVYRQLSRHKIFLRSISNRFCISYILKNYNAFSDVLNIMLKKSNGSYQESCSHSLRRMEKFKSDKYEKPKNIKFNFKKKRECSNSKNSKQNKNKEIEFDKDEEETSEKSTNEIETSTEYEESDEESNETDCSYSEEEEKREQQQQEQN